MMTSGGILGPWMGSEFSARSAKAHRDIVLLEGTPDDDDDDDDDNNDEWISRARHKQSSDTLPISETGGPLDIEQMTQGKELRFTEWLVNCTR